MKLFLQVEFSQRHQEGIGNQLLKYASSVSSDIMGTDLDGQSEPMIADLVLRMIGQAERIFLLVHATDPNLSLGATRRVFDALLQPGAAVSHAVLCGDHRTSELELTVFRNRFYKESDPEKIKALILEFSRSEATV